jgi:glycine dehydrogenase subunit 2
VTLQPAAGAHGEFTGMLLAKAYHLANNQDRNEVIVPDSAHGTNPASAAMAGFTVIEIPSGPDGCVDLEALKAALSERTAAVMVTNPNTLGLFEKDITELARMVHEAGALLYYDGANLNAIMGMTSPGKMDFDIVHFNLHKTFATPHGGGGPGAGPVGVKEFLEPYLPVPRIVSDEGKFHLEYVRTDSIGKVRSLYGNFAVLVRAYAYILAQGGNGLREVSQKAVLNSNYLKSKVVGAYEMPFAELRKHEFVISARTLAKEKGIHATDVAKALLDKGFMTPTIYFPSLVEEAIMIEPTETESKETLDRYAQALLDIAAGDPEEIKAAPQHTSVSRVDEVYAAKELILSWRIYQRKKGKGEQ